MIMWCVPKWIMIRTKEYLIRTGTHHEGMVINE